MKDVKAAAPMKRNRYRRRATSVKIVMTIITMMKRMLSMTMKGMTCVIIPLL